jgi:polar amino acid transport system ATP-binding protein
MAHNGEEVVHSQGKYNSYRQKMGMVFQNFYLFDHLTALGNVEIFLAES